MPRIQSGLSDILALAPVIPVLTFDTLDVAVPVARALVKGGLTVLEVTLRTPVGLDAIRAIAKAVPDAVVGAGTVVRPDQYTAVAEAGARFAVSPGFSPALLAIAADGDVPLLPGAITPAESITLLDAGYTMQKFFPAEPAGGVAMLKSMIAPLPEIRFCPTGGIDIAKAPTYLALSNVTCIGGSWVTPADTVAAGDWDRIEALAAEASALSRGRSA
jgi:2-dehydro-3-deoxyphosphogluconate aldolase/(4S)-4-hydroxy-2-oxoglutarate aldolase